MSEQTVSEQFEAFWTRCESHAATSSTTKAIAELCYRKGVIDGKEAILNEVRPLVESARDELAEFMGK